MNIATSRLHNQRLTGTPFDMPHDAVQWLGAVQAQDYAGAKWGLALRCRDADDTSLDRLFNEGAFLRTHIMRPTWHFVAPEDIRWVLALTSPRVHATNASHYRKLELDEKTFRRSRTVLTKALEGDHYLTRTELAGRLEAAGIEARGQRLAHIMMHAELDGLLCSGPLRGKQHTYALLDERVPPAPALDRDEALAELTRRYFTSHAPATPHDFAWWSGLTVSDARRGLEIIGDEVERIEVDDTPYWTCSPIRSEEQIEPAIHLLPNFDEHVVAYRDHGPTLDPAAVDPLKGWANSPLDRHLVARNGLLIGGWRRTIGKEEVIVTASLPVGLRRGEQAALQQAAERYGRFIGLPVVMEENK